MVVVVAFGSMGVAMGNFVRRGGSHTEDFDIKMEGDSSQRVVPVKVHMVSFDLSDGEDERLAVALVRHKAHANLNRRVAGELLTVDLGPQGIFHMAVALIWVYHNGFFRTACKSSEGCFKTRDDLSVAMKVHKRILGSRTIEFVTLGITEDILEADDGTTLDDK
jgi:hypothetical protein